MAKRALKQELLLWAKRVDADPYWFYRLSPSKRAERVVRKAKSSYGSPLMTMTHPERVLFLLLLAAGARA